MTRMKKNRMIIVQIIPKEMIATSKLFGNYYIKLEKI